MEVIDINQNVKLALTKKTIEWLVEHTTVSVFNPIDFSGYQRQIDENHCQDIVKYLKSDTFLLPTAIICACDRFSEDVALRIVDGQHRVKAFEMLREQDYMRFSQIKGIELPVIVLYEVPESIEIETFIKINKTSKKVDTSLAYVLKSKLTNPSDPDHFAMSKAEYLSVEAAQLLKSESRFELWCDKILFEGDVKKTDAFISLNSFVKTTRILVNVLKQAGVVNVNWENESEVKEAVDIVAELIDYIWKIVYLKWNFMYSASLDDRKILQGSIGYSAINRLVIRLLKEKSVFGLEEVRNIIRANILSISIDGTNWKKNGVYSKYSSEAGIRIIANDLYDSINLGKR